MLLVAVCVWMWVWVSVCVCVCAWTCWRHIYGAGNHRHVSSVTLMTKNTSVGRMRSRHSAIENCLPPLAACGVLSSPSTVPLACTRTAKRLEIHALPWVCQSIFNTHLARQSCTGSCRRSSSARSCPRTSQQRPRELGCCDRTPSAGCPALCMWPSTCGPTCSAARQGRQWLECFAWCLEGYSPLLQGGHSASLNFAVLDVASA